MKEVRRLASVMFTDIVSYSSMMSQDEQNALNIMRVNRAIQKTKVREYNGKWIKEIGDGALAMFDTAYDSVQCALAIQNEIREKCSHQVRIGIHLGDITIENNDAFGDGVNVASRIESIADPGGIYLSESVYKAIMGRTELSVQDLGEIELKNISYPIKTYAVQGEGLPIPDQTKSIGIDAKPGTQSKRSKYLVLYVMIPLLITVFAIWKYSPVFNSSKINESKLQSIAVLPFASLSDDPDQEFMVDGLHDAIIGKLSQIPHLRVISRTSTLRYRNTELPVPEIARQLNVDNIVEGSIFGSGDSYRVQMQLIKAFPDEAHIWSDEYNRGPDQFFTMKDDVFRGVAKALKVEFEDPSATAEEVNPEVYKLYLRGMHLLDKGKPEDMLTGMEFLKEAVEVDPTAAFAYAGLAQGYVILGHSPISENEHFIKAKAAARQALELDDQLADAYAALADVQMYYDWEYEAAWQNFEKAVSLKPNLAEAHAHYTWLHVIYERWDEAIAHAELTVELDPFSTIYTSWLAWLYWWAGRNDEAIEVASETIRLNPDFSIGYMVLGSAYAEKGMYEEAIDTLQHAVSISNNWTGHLMRALVKSGRRDEALTIYEAVKDELNPFTMGYVYASLEMRDETLKAIEVNINDQNRMAPWTHSTPFFQFLHDDPRFLELCRRVNIPEEVLKKEKKAIDIRT
jgi:class 3 adenylate cyclase/TolB-like protein/Tfp pilus assembly protein PilF